MRGMRFQCPKCSTVYWGYPGTASCPQCRLDSEKLDPAEAYGRADYGIPDDAHLDGADLKQVNDRMRHFLAGMKWERENGRIAKTSTDTCVYLSNGTKVVIERGPEVNGYVALKVVDQDQLTLQGEEG